MPIFHNTPGLLDQFRAGSAKAMEAVYWAYARRIDVLVRRGFTSAASGRAVRGVSPGEVEDLVQEIFARAFSERARLAFDGLREYGPFLATLARNLVLDWGRKQGREVSLEQGGPTLELPSDEAHEDEGPWASPEVARTVEAYLQALPPDLAALHHERYVRGQSQGAAAAALGLTRQQLRTREARLREGLEAALGAAEKK
jgi:RNA polymerase sigma-70 factor (ECF subfamily)